MYVVKRYIKSGADGNHYKEEIRGIKRNQLSGEKFVKSDYLTKYFFDDGNDTTHTRP